MDRDSGYEVGAIGGIDEAGRGPLAGPVVAAVVVLTPDQHIDGVRDSKQLTPRRRTALAAEIRCHAAAWSVARAEVAEIDNINILQATMLAMRRAVEQLDQLPDELCIDGNRAPELPGYHGQTTTIVGGDRTCLAISAASILAKVVRDDLMLDLDRAFPNYGFAQHKGYPTAQHREALLHYGPCAAHRRSFRPVRQAIEAGGGCA
ncbi:MAG: ribonuclease HII [Gammaproteobacteria bacterium]|nr:ribonuclease HII [Chromatiales bacterium]MDP6674776.1 ribonuclease HII [Gammaproteobacteria bacterium]